MTKRLDVMAAVVLASLGAGSMAAAQEGTRAPIFSLRADEILELYPAEARAKGLEGVATLACAGTYQQPSHCAVRSESPVGEGFGEAALALTRRYLADPASKPPRLVMPIMIEIPFTLPRVRTVRAGGVAYALPLQLERPSTDALHAAWPRAARFSGIEGLVDLWCTVGVDGRLHGCTVRKEQNRAQGFGAAALSMAPLFRYQPGLRDGRPAPMSISVAVLFGCDSHCRRFTGPAVRPERQWRAAPTPEQVQAAYPPAAHDRRAEGQARLNCTVGRGGALEACEVVGESVAGEGFGAAALSLTPLFRLAAPDPKAEPARIALVVAFGAPSAIPAWLFAGERYMPPLDAAGNPVQGEARVKCRVSAEGGLADCAVVGALPADPIARRELFKRVTNHEPQIWTEEGRSTIGAELELRVSLDPARRLMVLGGEARPPVVASGVIDYRPLIRISEPRDAARYYPDRAQRMEVNGRVELVCAKIVDERPDGCAVTKEDPLEYGFADAALKMSALFRYAPETIDGVPTQEPVTIPVDFKVPR